MLASENSFPGQNGVVTLPSLMAMAADQHKILRAATEENEQSLLESITRLAEGSPHGMLLIDESWRVVYANRRARALAPIQTFELNRPICWGMFPGIRGTILERALREAAAERTTQLVKHFYYEPIDKWMDVEVVPSGRDLAVYFQNISSSAIEEAARNLAAEQLKQVLEATTDAVLWVDRDWRMTSMNQRAKLTLASKGDLLGRNLWASFPEAVFEGSPYLEHYYRAMDEAIPSEFRAAYPDPLNAWFDVIVRPARHGIIIFFRDVTRVKLEEAALLEVEKLAVVAQLSSSIAHEINNPLMSVTNLLYLARHHAKVPEVQQFLDLAELELRRVSIITSQSLRFHKQLTLPQPVSCLELFTGALTAFESKFKNSGVHLEKRKRAQVPVRCFEGEIGQVLHEIVDNALDGCPREAGCWYEAAKPRTGKRAASVSP